MGPPVSESEKNGAVPQNRAQDSAEDAHEAKMKTIDVRAELKKNLAEEFTEALSAQTNLTDHQRQALIEAVNSNQVTPTSILQIIGTVEDQP